ncbi:U6 snRNA-associated Sm-like protein LSm4 [[Candida] jaroonii]|uniref:U6 snRNA-associated Sm-like protein LSm4 n=1 Tax=[Candida] jaroonii TaxID=467808 RepID=A0ACA9YF47_9ASCO|nr:U6 snRNA-associated Sm-like protein LSm4 [[Candida] jaroonii]
MLPLYILTSAKNQPILVELKNGETLNGLLTNCDSWMNLTLSEVIQTSPNGEDFLKIPEIYIRGNHIKYLRLPEQTMDQAKEQNLINMEQRNKNQRRRGNNNGNYNNNGNFNRRRNDNNQSNRRNFNNRRFNNNNNTE